MLDWYDSHFHGMVQENEAVHASLEIKHTKQVHTSLYLSLLVAVHLLEDGDVQGLPTTIREDL